MLPSHVTRSRKLAGFAGVVAAAAAGGALFASSAFAHHPLISGVADCTSAVTFTSTAWSGATVLERSNPKIQISYSTGGAYVALADTSAYRYDSTNSFAFTDTFTPPTGWTSLTLRATALGTWGSGAGAGDSRTSSPITPKTGCTPSTTTPTPTTVPAPVSVTPPASEAGSSIGEPAIVSPLLVTPAAPFEAAVVSPAAANAQVAASELPRTGLSALLLFTVGSLAVVLGGIVTLTTRRR